LKHKNFLMFSRIQDSNPLENPSTPSGVLKQRHRRGESMAEKKLDSKTPQHPPGY